MTENLTNKENCAHCEDEARREFLYLTTAGFGAAAVCGVAVPLINQMNPDKSVLALSTTDVDLSGIPEGQTKTVKWRGKPVFVKHRTAEEIADMQKVDVAELRDPQEDTKRVQKGHEEWLVVLGSCTHLGCVPSSNMGEHEGGWYCPCHGSHYDASGRIRKGPAPRNLDVPEYKFVSDQKIVIG